MTHGSDKRNALSQLAPMGRGSFPSGNFHNQHGVLDSPGACPLAPTTLQAQDLQQQKLGIDNNTLCVVPV